MVLTPLQKLLVIGFAWFVELAFLFWTGIKTDALGLGLEEGWFNIGLVLINTLSLGATSLLTYLGLKAPTVKEGNDEGAA